MSLSTSQNQKRLSRSYNVASSAQAGLSKVEIFSVASDDDADRYFESEVEEHEPNVPSKKRKLDQVTKEEQKVHEEKSASVDLASSSDEILLEDDSNMLVDNSESKKRVLEAYQAAAKEKQRAPVLWTGSFEPSLIKVAKPTHSTDLSGSESTRARLGFVIGTASTSLGSIVKVSSVDEIQPQEVTPNRDLLDFVVRRAAAEARV